MSHDGCVFGLVTGKSVVNGIYWFVCLFVVVVPIGMDTPGKARQVGTSQKEGMWI